MEITIKNPKLVAAAEKVMDSSVAYVSAVADLLKIVPDPAKMTKDEQSDVKVGLTNRAIAICKEEYYSRNGDSYTRCTAAEFKKLDATKSYILTAEYAMKSTAHEVGQMAQKEPGKHKIVARMRKKINTNVSNRLRDIKSIARNDHETGDSKPRNTYTVRATADRALAKLNKSFASRRKNGDPAAPSAERVALAEAAYIKHLFG